MVTAFELFAAMAPFPANGFNPVMPPKPQHPINDLLDMSISKDHLQEIRDWHRDPVYDLPEHLQWFSEKVWAFQVSEQEWKNKYNSERDMQWRIHYATEMVKRCKAAQDTDPTGVKGVNGFFNS